VFYGRIILLGVVHWATTRNVTDVKISLEPQCKRGEIGAFGGSG